MALFRPSGPNQSLSLVLLPVLVTLTTTHDSPVAHLGLISVIQFRRAEGAHTGRDAGVGMLEVSMLKEERFT